MIVDARLVNLLCRKPPHVSLSTSETLRSFEFVLPDDHVEDGSSPFSDLHAYFGKAGVKNCFHRLIMDDHFSDLFALDTPFLARECGLEGVCVSGRIPISLW